MASLVLFLIGLVFVFIGIKTMKKREAKITIQLWSWGSDDGPRSTGGGSSESVHTGFVAVLIGVVELMLGVGAMLQAFMRH